MARMRTSARKGFAQPRQAMPGAARSSGFDLCPDAAHFDRQLRESSLARRAVPGLGGAFERRRGATQQSRSYRRRAPATLMSVRLQGRGLAAAHPLLDLLGESVNAVVD